MSPLRPFETADLPAVASLRRRCFRRTRATTDEELSRYIRKVFLENPWRDHELPSWVVESAPGEIDGFIGVIPRPMTVHGKPVRAAVVSQLMVAPEKRGVVAAGLLRRAFQGPQELLLTDVPTAAVKRLWEAAGGSTSEAYGFCWEHPVRAGAPGGGLFSTALEAVARLTPWHPLAGAERHPSADAFPPDAIAEALPTLVEKGYLRGEYDGRSLRWLLRRAAEKWGAQRLRGTWVAASDGALAGWFLYVRQDSGAAELLQLVSSREHTELVWRRLLVHAAETGASIVRGRYDPRLIGVQQRAPRCSFRASGPGVLAHGRDGTLVARVLGGNAVLTGLDGEWWLDF